MKAIIPAAGIGKRLQPLTFFLPKPLFYVGSKRIIDYVILSLSEVEIDEYIVIVGYKKEMLKEHLLKNYPDKKFTFVEQEKQSGLGDAVFKGLKEIEGKDYPLVVLLSDTIIDLDVKRFLKTKNSKIALMEVEDPKRFGVAKVSEDFVVDVVEKPEHYISNKAIVGFYYFKSSKKLFESLNYLYENNIRTRGEIQLTDGIKKMIDDGEKVEYGDVKKWIDCGDFETLLKANSLLLKIEKRKNFIDPSSDIKDFKELFDFQKC
jgi:glucose-1-phosphate thymidylyltransferase